MRKVNVWPGSLIILLAAAFVLNSCKKTFDEPPGPSDPSLSPTHTIKEFRALHNVSGALDVINTDIIISGIVVANDRSGNLYKEIYIQDGTAGINVLLDANGLYNSFPVGRKVFIKCKGLCLSDYNRLPQLGIRAVVAGNPSIQAIASTIIDQFVVGGSLNNPVVPKLVTVSQLTTNMNDDNLGTLIQLNNYEFIASDTSKTFADTSSYRNSVNLTVKGCAGGTNIIIRSSGYANFAGISAPNGNGTLTAIYTLFGSTKQLIIRDTSDVQFTNFRCGQGPTTVINIADLRALHTGTTTFAPDGRRITGVVISDRSNANINSQNLVLQQGTGLSGITVRFDSPHSYNLGDSIDVIVSLQELSTFNGLLQVNQVPLAYASLKATGKTITPRATTVADILTNFETWESTLIGVTTVTLSPPGAWSANSGVTTVTQGASTIDCFTFNAATFSGTTKPVGNVDMVAIVNQGGSSQAKQLSIRNLGDVIGSAPPPPVNDLIISEYVEGSSNNKYIEIYNAGASAANLADYTVKLYANGSTTAGNTQVLSALSGGPSTLAAGATLVLRNASAVLTLPAGVTAYSSNVCNFNGDDVIEIEKNSTVIDVFGSRGIDPGTSWTIAGNTSAAVDKTVRRKTSVTTGETNWTVSAGTDAASSQWIVVTTLNEVSNLGTR